MDPRLLERVRELTRAFTIREGRPDAADAQAFCELFNRTYPRQVSPDYYRWQFFDAPADNVCLFAELEDRIVGCYGLRSLACTGGLSSLIGLTVDLIVAPEARRTGLMLRMESEMEPRATGRGCAALYATPNQAAYLPRTRDLDWSPLEPGITWAAPCEPTERGDAGLKFRKVARFGDEVGAIGETFARARSSQLIVRRDRAYLNWRFADCPWYDYDLFVVDRGQRVVGYLVLKVFTDPVSGKSTGDIVDLSWAEEDLRLVGSMLRFARLHFGSLDVGEAGLWADGDPLLRQSADDAGFRPTSRSRHRCCRILDPSHDWLAASNRWFWTMADSEVY